MQVIESQRLLPRYTPSEYVKMFEECSGDELLTAVYTRAMQHDCFKHYRPRYEPPIPNGYMDIYNDYQSISKLKTEDRSKVWKVIQEKHSGYLKAKQELAGQNRSDISFLEDMKKHFQGLGMMQYVETIDLRLMDFRHPGVAA